MRILKTISLTFLMLSGIIFMALTYAVAPANFKGKWALDISKSDFGNFPVPKASNAIMRIVQQDPVIIIESSKTDSLGKAIVRIDTVILDGKTRKINGSNGSVINRSSVRQWSVDQQVMSIVSKFSVDNSGQPLEFSGTESWSLGDGGKMLKMVMESRLPDKTEKATKVYNRVD
jgi:hypothetical protein